MLTNKPNGFTLIELAVVLFIVGLILAGILTPMATSVESSRRSILQEQYDDIKEVLIGFAIVNGRLPCPDCPDDTTGNCAAGDENDGIEDGDADGSCKVGVLAQAEGNLPWVTLGVTGIDPWGRTLVYQVQQNYADTTDGTGASCSIKTGVSFQLCSSAGITIQDKGDVDDGCLAAPAPEAVATNVPLVVYSQGRQTATSCNELENTGGDNVFVVMDYNQTAGTYYDDMILWISPFLLNSRMVEAELLP